MQSVCTFDLCIHSLILSAWLFFVILVHCSNEPDIPIIIHNHAYCTCIPLWLSVKQYFTSAFSRCMLLKSSDMYFEYSKCRTFCEFLIYVYEWFLFSLPWQRSVIFSPLQIVLMVKNEPHFCFPFCIILQLFCAVFLLHSVKFYCCYIITIIAELTA